MIKYKIGSISFMILLFVYLTTSANEQTYRAVVLEYYPVQNFSLTPEQRTNANVDRYIELIEALGEQDYDIIVYPEGTITTGQIETRENLLELATIVPEKTENVVPCGLGSYSGFFSRLSCFAIQLSTYMVVNLIEKQECSSSACAGDGWNMYNTDVVFDRNGKVIQKYRKYNLFGEYGMNVTDKVEVATFETDFNVTFGLFTCFDILFEEPALQLVRQGVKHIIFPTMWFSELPFLTALQAQSMFSIENDVALLSSGANSAIRGSGGTGIYQGNLGPIDYEIIANDGSKVYVADVLKSWNSSVKLNSTIKINNTEVDRLALEMDNFYLKKDNLSAYSTYPVVEEIFTGSIGNADIQCQVSWKISGVGSLSAHYDYLFFYFSGIRSFDNVRNGGMDVCGFVSCQAFAEDVDYEECGSRYPSYADVEWPYVIEELSISANFTSLHSSSHYPNTLLSSIRPLDVSEYSWTSRYFPDENLVERTLTLLEPQDRLMTFAIYGRDFTRDSSGNWKSRANWASVLVLVLISRFL